MGKKVVEVFDTIKPTVEVDGRVTFSMGSDDYQVLRDAIEALNKTKNKGKKDDG